MTPDKSKFKDDVATNDRSQDQLEELRAKDRIHIDVPDVGARVIIEVSWDSWINIKPIVMALADNILPKGMAQA
jgi:hypothetical protein